MNKRIDELAEQTKPVDENGQKVRGLNSEYHDQWMEKFAELIVQEMLRLLEQCSRDSFPEDDIDDFYKGYLAGLHTAQNVVKKHFGIKE